MYFNEILDKYNISYCWENDNLKIDMKDAYEKLFFIDKKLSDSELLELSWIISELWGDEFE